MVYLNYKGQYSYLSIKDEYGRVRNQIYFLVAKCISDDSIILTKEGNVMLSDLQIGKTFEVMSYNTKLDEYEYNIAKKINSGKKIVYEVETVKGKKIKASEDHVFFVMDNGRIIQKKLRDLKQNDEVITYD